MPSVSMRSIAEKCDSNTDVDRETADPSALTLAIANAKADVVVSRVAGQEPAIVICSGLFYMHNRIAIK